MLENLEYKIEFGNLYVIGKWEDKYLKPKNKMNVVFDGDTLHLNGNGMQIKYIPNEIEINKNTNFSYDKWLEELNKAYDQCKEVYERYSKNKLDCNSYKNIF